MHAMALKEVNFAAASIARERGETVTDFAAMPTLANPFRWLAVAETDRAAYRFEVSVTDAIRHPTRSEEHTSELPSLMRISYAVFCLQKQHTHYTSHHRK